MNLPPDEELDDLHNAYLSTSRGAASHVSASTPQVKERRAPQSPKQRASLTLPRAAVLSSEQSLTRTGQSGPSAQTALSGSSLTRIARTAQSAAEPPRFSFTGRRAARFAQTYARLAAYVAAHGDLPDAHREMQRTPLTRWCGYWRARRNRLTPGQREQLEALATPAAERVWYWSRSLLLWHRAFRHIARFVAQACRLPFPSELPAVAGVGDLIHWWHRQVRELAQLSASQQKLIQSLAECCDKSELQCERTAE